MPSISLSQPPNITVMPGTFEKHQQYRLISFVSTQMLLAIYFYLVIVAYIWDRSLEVIEKTLLKIHQFTMTLGSIIDSILEFSKSVKYYIFLTRKVFEYRMYKNVN